MNLDALVAARRHPEVWTWHVSPAFGRAHSDSPDCWCLPELEYKDPENGAEIWLHHAEH